MGIDWVTFFAQIINLIVLVWLLKRFLYKPILNAVDKRQNEILNRVNGAKKAELEAAAKLKEYEQKLMDFEAEKKALFLDAKKNAEAFRDKQLADISLEIAHQKEKLQAGLNKEKEILSVEIRNLMADDFSEMARKIMAELSDQCPLEQTLTLFYKKIDDLPPVKIKNIKETFKKQNDIKVFSSDTLSKKQQAQLAENLKQKFSLTPQHTIKFKKDPALMLGLEMHVGDLCIEWHLKNYLDTFQDNLNNKLSGLIIK